MLAYGADSGFFFCRTCAHAENNAIACFWGTTADKWYSFHQIFIVKNNDEEEEQETTTEDQWDSVPSKQ